jgi:hypothetical protein
MSYQQNLEKIKLRWTQIPKNAAVFPGFLFRPNVWPLFYGNFIGDFPKYLINRFPPIAETLEEKGVPYLLLSDFDMDYLPPDVVGYIRNHYEKVNGDLELWVRLKEPIE